MKISYNMVKTMNFLLDHKTLIMLGYLLDFDYAEWLVESSVFIYKKLQRIKERYPNKPLNDFVIDCKFLQKNYTNRTYDGLRELLEKLLKN